MLQIHYKMQECRQEKVTDTRKRTLVLTAGNHRFLSWHQSLFHFRNLCRTQLFNISTRFGMVNSTMGDKFFPCCLRLLEFLHRTHFTWAAFSWEEMIPGTRSIWNGTEFRNLEYDSNQRRNGHTNTCGKSLLRCRFCRASRYVRYQVWFSSD